MSGSSTLYLKEVVTLENDNGNGYRLGLDAYPIFDASYRDPLNRKIVNHFWNWEIGLETVDLFKFNLARKMAEIMPYYNQLYKSTQIEFDPLATFSLSTVRNNTGTDTSSGTSSTSSAASATSASRAVGSDTPQTELSDDEDYASNATDTNSASNNTGSGSAQSNNTQNTSANGTSTTTGFQGAASELLMRYRATLLNIDMLIIDDLTELFMRIRDNGSEMLAPRFYAYGGMY